MIIVFPPYATSTLRIGVDVRFATVSIGARHCSCLGASPARPEFATKVPTDDNRCQWAKPHSERTHVRYYILFSTACFANNMRNEIAEGGWRGRCVREETNRLRRRAERDPSGGGARRAGRPWSTSPTRRASRRRPSRWCSITPTARAFRPQTRERVIKAAAKLGYQPVRRGGAPPSRADDDRLRLRRNLDRSLDRHRPRRRARKGVGARAHRHGRW